ncbi:MAG: 2-oxoglutarate dehydrogenase E1 component [Planctomycetota bacterium]
MNSYSLDYIDDLYVQFVRDPSSVSDTWRQYFEQFLVTGSTAARAAGADSANPASSGTLGSANAIVSSNAGNRAAPSGVARSIAAPTGGGTVGDAPVTKDAVNGNAVNGDVGVNGDVAGIASNGQVVAGGDPSAAHWAAQFQDRVNNLVREYRVRGHLVADLDPLGIGRPDQPDLSPEKYGLSPEDLSRHYDSGALESVMGGSIQSILDRLRNTYCRRIGAQFMHIDNRNIRDWLQRRMESSENRLELSHEVQRRIYTRLADASIFEEFVRRKFVGAKTFSLEGAESLIPLIDLALEKAGQHHVKEVVMGMAHRGRLNVMANILKKRATNIFWSFDDPNPELSRGGGDVRYHLGYSSDWKTAAGHTLHISLCFNPSHLEYVNTVAQGRCRSKQDRRGDRQRNEVMTILVHGDAAFAGEGVVQETLNLSELDGYRTGGTLHIIINNQVGFTTEPAEGRSTTYASDVAKMLQIPIFHVNGEDPEAVAQVVSLAMDFRKEFARDVVIDLYAFRRWGHNEGDEPRFTQPKMYSEIDNRASIREQYQRRLRKLGSITEDEVGEIQKKRTEKLEREFAASKNEPFVADTQTLADNWSEYFGGVEPTDPVDTSCGRDQLCDWIDRLTRVPSTFSPHKKLKRWMATRRKMATGEAALDWATAEAAAMASLVAAGHPLRMTGQDCQRGTFSQRHAVLHDVNNGDTYMPLREIAADQTAIEMYNSPLSEAGVLGFEYGYSLDCPDGLVVWEAQFGDFWNCAQVIVDQFIASAEDKWNRLSGLVLLLPHGFEGQGPEHCSARVERWLAMAAEHNIQVVQPTTPAQYFHLLRRQVIRKWRKPLIVMTPKSLLRHPEAVSSLEDLSEGGFRKILPDPEVPASDCKRLLMCSGKVYYDLIAARRERGISGVSIMRIEELYPLSIEEIQAEIQGLPESAEIVWVQDEPTNMGCWPYIKLNFGDDLVKTHPLRRVSRVESASPSTGSMAAHKLEQADLLNEAFEGLG